MIISNGTISVPEFLQSTSRTHFWHAGMYPTIYSVNKDSGKISGLFVTKLEDWFLEIYCGSNFYLNIYKVHILMIFFSFFQVRQFRKSCSQSMQCSLSRLIHIWIFPPKYFVEWFRERIRAVFEKNAACWSNATIL